MNKHWNKIILFLVIAATVLAIVYLEFTKTNRNSFTINNMSSLQINTSTDKSNQYLPALELDLDGGGYINTTSISIKELIGKKVILLDIWTYSCINCQRTLPYINSWYEKYKDQGLEIIGVHSPEFTFEKKYENVKSAVDKFNIKYPVVLDNNFGTWKRYQNSYWPRKYLIDIDGYIVYDHIGEGSYNKTEKKIQELLAERKKVLKDKINISSDITVPKNVEKVDFTISRSPEIYFGAWRNNAFGNGTSLRTGIQDLLYPTKIKADTLYLTGRWDIAKEYAENKSKSAKIVFKYKAEKVFMVAESDSSVKVKIYRDGNLVNSNAGGDVVNGEVVVKKSKLYRLIKEQGGISEHTLEIIIEGPGLKAYTFTFG